MNILIISHMYPSTFSVSTELFIHQQVLALSRVGHEVKVICPIPYSPFPLKYLSSKWKKYSEVPKMMIWDGIEVYYPRYIEFPKAFLFYSSGERMYRGIIKTSREIFECFPFDVVHSHVALPDGYAGMLISEKYKKPLIVTIHGVDLQQTIFRNKKCKDSIKKVIDHSGKIIVVSNKLRDVGIDQLNAKNDKIVVINNGIMLSDVFQNKTELAKKYVGKRILLSVSNLIKTKGIDYNIKAFAKLNKKYSNLIYIVIGNGPEKDNLKKLAINLGVSDSVIFLSDEAKDHDKIIEYMSICDIFTLPSWNEGFGIVYIEAMANDKPVIACKGEGPTGFIKDKETGILVEPKNVESVAGALDYLLSNPQKALEIAERGKKLVLEKYTWERICRQISDVYKSVV